MNARRWTIKGHGVTFNNRPAVDVWFTERVVDTLAAGEVLELMPVTEHEAKVEGLQTVIAELREQLNVMEETAPTGMGDES